MPRSGHTIKLPSNECFGCGKDNPYGMKLKFDYDEAGGKFTARIRLQRHFAGPPGQRMAASSRPSSTKL